MKNILKSALLILVICGLASCTVTEPQTDGYLDVTANNLSGDWMLETWNNGLPAGEDVSVYIRFVRKGSRYEMYSNVGSMGFVRQTGPFVILEDEEWGYIIKGSYDNTLNEEWNHKCIVSLTADRMVWTAYDDLTDVCVYVRHDIPEEITSAFPEIEED